MNDILKKAIPYASKVILLFSGFLALYLTAKFFGPYNRGIIATSAAIVSFVATFGGLSIGRTILFDIDKCGLNTREYFKDNLFSYLVLILVLIVISIFFSWLWFTFFPKTISDIPKFVLIGSFFILPYLMWASYSSFIFASLDLLNLQSVFAVILEVVYLTVLIFGIVFFGLNLTGFILLTGFTRLCGVGIEVLFLYRNIEPVNEIKLAKMWSVAKNGLILHLDSISGYFIASVNVLLVNSFLQKDVVGKFDMSMRLTTMLLIIPTVSQVYISGHISKLGLRNSWPVIHQSIFRSLLAVVAMIVFNFLFMDYLINWFFGPVYLDASICLKYLSPYIIFNSLCMMFSPFALSKGYFKLMSFLTFILGALNLSLGYFSIPRFGVYGMVISTDIVYFVAVVINIFIYFKIKREVFS